MLGSKIAGVTYDILKGLNVTIWGGVEGAEKVSKSIKTGLSGADVIIGTSHALEDYTCNDFVCCAFDIVGSISSAAGLVLGNMPHTKHLTFVTSSVTIGCRTVRFYCKNYGTYWGCITIAAKGAKKAIKFRVSKTD